MINKIAERAANTDYFVELFSRLENYVLDVFLKINHGEVLFNQKELNDILRFCDIFASCSISQYRNYSIKIIADLYSFYSENYVFKSYAYSIFVKMGLFPSAELIKKGNSEDKLTLPIDIELLEFLKNIIQKDEELKIIYTDKQYEVVNELNKKNSYSLSAPTSFGKTMIISNFINKVVKEKKNCNVCILVPTNALLKEITQDMKLKYEKKEDASIKVISYPEIKPKDLQYNNLIFVFTPERLCTYFMKDSNPEIEYLFVDEAQKIIRVEDDRAPIYYSVVSYAGYKGAKLYFLSPNIDNPEVFLNLVNRDSKNKKRITDKLVSQNRFIFDFSEKKVSYLTYNNEIITKNINSSIILDVTQAIKEIYVNYLESSSTLVYFSSKSKMFETLMEYIDGLNDTENDDIKKLINIVKDTIHEKYFLVKALEKGIAFHYGQMPKMIREKIEELFKNKTIKLLFTTSTLLEGVNVQAKNIILTSDSNGLSNLSEEDFLNLIGRAGRFKSELSGNVICIKINNKKNLFKHFKSEYVSDLSSEIMDDSKRGNFYKDIKQIVQNKKPISKNLYDEHKKLRIRSSYANIAVFHNKINYDSKLKTNLIKVNDDQTIFNQIERKENTADKLSQYGEYVSIPLEYQNKIYSNEESLNFDFLNKDLNNIEYSDISLLLEYIFDEYKIYERGLVKYKKSHTYYSHLLMDWIKGRSLKVIISKTIEKYENNEIPFLVDEYYENKKRKYRPYNGSDKQVNMIINDILEKIETDIKHMIKIHLSNFIYLNVENGNLNEKYLKLVDYVEFGTMNNKIIELQKYGFSRELAVYLIEKHITEIIFDNEELESIDFENIFMNFDKTNPLISELEEYKYLLNGKD